MSSVSLIFGILWLTSGDKPEVSLTYDILVDGLRSGSMTRKVSRLSDNETQFTTHANSTVRYLFLTFRYQFNGSEIWSNDKIKSLQGDCNDDGTRHHVRLTSTSGSSTLIRNRQQTVLATLPWTTGGCRPPPGEGTYLTLDPDTGAVKQTRFSKGNPETYLLAGESIRGHAWETDLPGNVRFFFDDTGKLLRQSWHEQGKRVEIRLASLSEN
jgi:hypothetical protein